MVLHVFLNDFSLFLIDFALSLNSFEWFWNDME